MNIKTAVKRLINCHNNRKWSYWIRPASWNGIGVALTMTSGNTLVMVPGNRGGYPVYAFKADEITEDWELVEAKKVLLERANV